MKKTISCNFIVNDDFQKLWSLEEIPSDSISVTIQELFCKEYFNETVSRDVSGKFEVTFPFKDNRSVINASKGLTIKGLLIQEKKLANNDALSNEYISFIKESLHENCEYVRMLFASLCRDSKREFDY